MSYINTQGNTAGPLQIEASGTWLTHSVEKEPIKVTVDGVTVTPSAVSTTSVTPTIEEQQYTKYLGFSRVKNIEEDDVNLVPLMAGHPLCGTYPSGDGNAPFCDLNAVATVGWVMTYATLAPGSKALALDNIIYRKEFDELASTISSHTTSIQDLYDITTNNSSQILTNKNNISTINNNLVTYNNRLTAVETLSDTNKNKIAVLENWKNSITTEGMILVGWAKNSDPSMDWGE